MKPTDKNKIGQRVYILDEGQRVYGTITDVENNNRIWILWDDLSEEVVHYPGEPEYSKIVKYEEL